MLCLFLALFIQASYAQISLTGTVTESDGTPLIGVNILEKNTNNGSITDIDGNYELNVTDENSVLEFSYLGFETQEMVVGGQRNISIVLGLDANELDEIIVVGYGVQKKKVVTGAITKVRGEDLEEQPIATIDEALQGRTSGVRVISNSGQPGDGATIRVRGTSSFGASDPLFVVDGIPIGGGIDFINPSDIESIEVLKDAASASIYGTRGTGGVILVTTKSGKEGKTEVNFQSYYGIQAPEKYVPVLNGVEYGTLMNEASVASGGEVLFDDPSTLGEGTDWQKAVFRNDAPMQDHQLSITTGNDKTSVFASFGYYEQEGIVIGSKYDRFTTRFNITQKINDNIKFGSTLAYAKIKSEGVSTNSEFGSPLGRALNLDPLTSIIEQDSAVLNSSVFQNFNVVTDESGNPYGISEYVTSEVLNPVAANKVNQSQGFSDKFVASFFGELTFLENFKLRSSLGTDLAFWGGENFSPLFYLNSANRNDLTSYGRSQNRGLYWIQENFLSYTLDTDDHSFSVGVGTAVEKNKGQGISITVTDIPVDNLEDASLGFFTAPDNQFAGGFEYLNTRLAYIGRFNYNFQERYLLSAVMRADGSSSFGPNNRFGYFPSVSLGWIMSDENFFDFSWINYFKLRGSYGILGNDNAGQFGYVSTLGGGRSYTFGLDDILTNGVVPDALANPDLKWERTIQSNVGFDAKIFKNLSVTFDIFNKATDGLLLGISVPGYVGNGGPLGNIADMSNKGFDLELSYDNNVGDVTYGISGNFSYVKNEVVSVGLDKEFLPGIGFGPSGLELTRTTPGLPIGYFYGFETDGIFQNQAEVDAYVNTEGALIQPDASPGDFKFVDANDNGVIDADDRGYLGDPTPKYTYGFGADLGYKNFELSIFGVGVAGNQILNATRRFDLPMANLSGEALNRWTGEGTSDTYPRLNMLDPNGNFNRLSDFFLESGSFLRIKTVQLSYDFPGSTIDNIGFKKVRFYIQAKNLLTITDYKGYDPEIGGGSYGIDRGYYPQARTFIFGLNASF